jgi:hypothetical protein
MPTALTLHDETTSGELRSAITLHLPEPTITARELIRSRVFEEVKAYNQRTDGLFQGLVQPKKSEQDQSGFRVQGRHRLDWHEQAETALQAFSRNGFILLVDDRQVESLDEEIRVRPETRVTFLKLVPLVGG